MTTIRITVETIDEDSDKPHLKQTCEIEITRGEHRFFSMLDHKATYTAFQFWKDLRTHFKQELGI